MDYMKTEEAYRSKWWSQKLQGLPFDEACRVYVLQSRPRQYISVPPVQIEEVVDGSRIIRYQKALKQFPADEPERKHCFSREELLAETHRLTGCGEPDAETLLHRLFAFQPDLTYNRYGAVCKQTSLPEFATFGGTVSIPGETMKGELPEEWYISLQITDALIARMVWACRKPGMTECHPCSSRFAEEILKLYKKRRGDFIRKHSCRTLKFLWLEYGSLGFPQAKIIQTVNKYRRNTEC